MTSSLLDKTLATIAELPNHPEGYGFIVSETMLEEHRMSPDTFVRAIFDEVDLPLTITQQHGNLTITLDHEALAREATKQ